MDWAEEQNSQLLQSCSSGSDLSSFNDKSLQLCPLFVVCRTQIIFACANLTWQVVEGRNKVRRDINTLNILRESVVTDGEDTVKFWWRSQTKAIYNRMIWDAIFIEIGT